MKTKQETEPEAHPFLSQFIGGEGINKDIDTHSYDTSNSYNTTTTTNSHQHSRNSSDTPSTLSSTSSTALTTTHKSTCSYNKDNSIKASLNTNSHHGYSNVNYDPTDPTVPPGSTTVQNPHSDIPSVTSPRDVSAATAMMSDMIRHSGGGPTPISRGDGYGNSGYNGSFPEADSFGRDAGLSVRGSRSPPVQVQPPVATVSEVTLRHTADRTHPTGGNSEGIDGKQVPKTSQQGPSSGILLSDLPSPDDATNTIETVLSELRSPVEHNSIPDQPSVVVAPPDLPPRTNNFDDREEVDNQDVRTSVFKTTNLLRGRHSLPASSNILNRIASSLSQNPISLKTGRPGNSQHVSAPDDENSGTPVSKCVEENPKCSISGAQQHPSTDNSLPKPLYSHVSKDNSVPSDRSHGVFQASINNPDPRHADNKHFPTTTSFPRSILSPPRPTTLLTKVSPTPAVDVDTDSSASALAMSNNPSPLVHRATRVRIKSGAKDDQELATPTYRNSSESRGNRESYKGHRRSHSAPVQVQIIMTSAPPPGAGPNWSGSLPPHTRPPPFKATAPQYMCCAMHLKTHSRIIAVTEIFFSVVLFFACIITGLTAFSVPATGMIIGGVATVLLGAIVAALILVGLRRDGPSWFIPYLVVKAFQMGAVGLALFVSVLGLLGFTTIFGLVQATSGNSDYYPPENPLLAGQPPQPGDFSDANSVSIYNGGNGNDNLHEYAGNARPSPFPNNGGSITSTTISASIADHIRNHENSMLNKKAYDDPGSDNQYPGDSLDYKNPPANDLDYNNHNGGGGDNGDDKAEKTVNSLTLIFATIFITFVAVLGFLIAFFVIQFKCYRYLKEKVAYNAVLQDAMTSMTTFPGAGGNNAGGPYHQDTSLMGNMFGGGQTTHGPAVTYQVIPRRYDGGADIIVSQQGGEPIALPYTGNGRGGTTFEHYQQQHHLQQRAQHFSPQTFQVMNGMVYPVTNAAQQQHHVQQALPSSHDTTQVNVGGDTGVINTSSSFVANSSSSSASTTTPSTTGVLPHSHSEPNCASPPPTSVLPHNDPSTPAAQQPAPPVRIFHDNNNSSSFIVVGSPPQHATNFAAGDNASATPGVVFRNGNNDSLKGTPTNNLALLPSASSTPISIGADGSSSTKKSRISSSALKYFRGLQHKNNHRNPKTSSATADEDVLDAGHPSQQHLLQQLEPEQQQHHQQPFSRLQQQLLHRPNYPRFNQPMKTIVETSGPEATPIIETFPIDIENGMADLSGGKICK